MSQPLRIAVLYTTVGSAWILFSDRAATALVRDPETQAAVNTLKGWLFVAVTALLLHFLVRRLLTRVQAAATARAAAEAERGRAETGRALAREEATAAGQRLALATQVAGLGTWEWDLESDRLLCDAQMHALHRVAPGELPGTARAWMTRIHPADIHRVHTEVQAALTGQQDYHVQFRLLWPDRQVRHIESHATIQRDASGRAVRLIGVCWDITDHVNAEQRYRLLADNVGDVLWILDTDTLRFTYVSPSIERLRGYTAAEVIQQSLEECLTPASLAIVHAQLPLRLQAFLAGEQALAPRADEIEQYRRDGSTIWTEIVTTVIRNESGRIEILGVTRDVSRRRAAEHALRHAEEIAGIGHWTFHLDDLALEGSDNAAVLYGLPPGRRWSTEQIRELTLPEFRPQVAAALRALLAGERPYDVIYRIRRPDTGAVAAIHSRAELAPSGRTVFGTIQDITAREQTLGALRASEAKLRLLVGNAPVVLFQIGADGRFRMSEGGGLAQLGLHPGEVVGRSVYEVYRDTPGICDQVRDALAGRSVHDQIRIGEIWFEIFYNPMLDDTGTVTDVIGLAIDITERKDLEEQALRAQRLDSVGRLAGGIAHDLNNILAPVLMAPSVLRDAVSDPGALEVLDAVEASAGRGAAIIRQLLTFSRGGDTARHPVQLRHVVRDMVSMIRETFPKNIVTRTDLAPEPWLVQGDPTQLHQVLMNLCVNSRDAMPAGGSLLISLENVELDAAAIAGHPGAAPGPHLLLGVVDNGDGIAAELLDKVFDPFFTTKEVGKGTGLGLATVLGIVRAHHGLVQIRSKPGAGTQVRVYLPACPAAALPAEPAQAAPPRGHGELILVVDDEENVRRVTRRILERHGYLVTTAGDGAEAVARFQQQREAVRLILTDLLMPFVDGPALIRAVREIDPLLPIIAVSGHAPETGPQFLEVGREISAFLPKPYSRHTLLQSVAETLAKAPAPTNT